MPDATFVRKFTSGFSNTSDLYESATGEKFVFRQQVYTGGTGRLDNEVQILRFLDYMGVDFVPKSLFFDPAQNLHVISFVEGKDIGPREFSAGQARIFARKLAQIHDIPVQAYKQWCADENLPEPVSRNLDGFEDFLTTSEKIISENCPDGDLAQWVKQNVARCQRYIAETKIDLKSFVHGDLGGNMKWDGKDLSFVDWESGGLRDSTDLGFIFIHGSVLPEIQKIIMAEYINVRNFSPEQATELKKWTDLEMKMQQVDKVVYRARRYSELWDTDRETALDFRDKAYRVLEEEFGGLDLNAAVLTPSLPEAAPF